MFAPASGLTLCLTHGAHEMEPHQQFEILAGMRFTALQMEYYRFIKRGIVDLALTLDSTQKAQSTLLLGDNGYVESLRVYSPAQRGSALDAGVYAETNVNADVTVHPITLSEMRRYVLKEISRHGEDLNTKTTNRLLRLMTDLSRKGYQLYEGTRYEPKYNLVIRARHRMFGSELPAFEMAHRPGSHVKTE